MPLLFISSTPCAWPSAHARARPVTHAGPLNVLAPLALFGTTDG